MARQKKGASLSFKRCLEMLRSRDAMTQDEGYFTLLPHVNEHLDALITALQAEKDLHMRQSLLELVAASGDPASFPVLLENVFASNDRLQTWARSGLAELHKTSGGRHILWQIHFGGVEIPPSVAHTAADIQALQDYVAQLLTGERRDCAQQ